jgi:hypothetical protein
MRASRRSDELRPIVDQQAACKIKDPVGDTIGIEFGMIRGISRTIVTIVT